jgi:hypothetical protein
MTGSKRRVSRRGRFALLGAVVATAAMAFGVTSAQASPVPLSATFDDAQLNLPSPAGTSDICCGATNITMTGTIDATTGAIAVPHGNFSFPSFSGTLSGIPLMVDFSAIDDITGTGDLAGDVNTDPSTYETVVTLGTPLNSSCTYDSDESFSTGAATPFNGEPFTVNLGNPVTITDGTVQTHWGANHFNLVNSTGDCSLVTGIINSACGGLSMSNNQVPTASDCTATGGGNGNPTSPINPAGNVRKRKCKKAKKHSAQSAKKTKCKKKKK